MDKLNRTSRLIILLAVLLLAAIACTREAPTDDKWNPSDQGLMVTACPAGVNVEGSCILTPTPTLAWFLPPTRQPDEPIPTPTPDPPRVIPTLRSEPSEYYVQPGDSLAGIASRYNVSYETIAEQNGLFDPNLLSAGQLLIIPAPTPSGSGPDFKIIPDSELVDGPMSTTLALTDLVNEKAGYLSSYNENVDGTRLSGAQIVARVAEENSVNPRLLLAVLEYQSQWLTNPNPAEGTFFYPIGFLDERRDGLYKQLSWAANNLNRGFYLWQANAVPAWLLADGMIIPPAARINAGTAGIQHLFSQLYGYDYWVAAVGENGLFETYQELFGYPFDLGVENLVPAGLQQPRLQLPFEKDIEWSFTGGPHGGWGDGSAWSGLDFAPPGIAVGCVESDAWVTAIADGVVLRSGNGYVLQDLDGDGWLQTGWVILYLHLETRDRVPVDSVLKAGDRIGHPSCEGGISNGTHVHIARRYNGVWIAADGMIPFDLEGWTSSGTGTVYDGFLTKNGVSIEAWDGRRPENQISRE